MAKTVVGLFDNPQDAQAALREVQSAGIGGSNAGLLSSASSDTAGILSQLRIPQHDAELYAEGLRSGGALVVLQQLGDHDAEHAADILDRHNIVDIESRAHHHHSESTATSTSQASHASTATSGSTARRSSYEGGETVIPIVEEEIRIGKREVESGGVRVQTRVEERPVNEQVTLRNEEVRVDRRPVDQPVDAATADSAFREGSFEMRERDEQAVVSKEARVVEEVVVGKEVQQRTETIQDTVRRTDVDVDQLGGTQTQASGYTQTSGSASTRGVGSSADEGMIEGGASRLGNAVEGATGLDLDRDGDTGRRDPSNNY